MKQPQNNFAFIDGQNLNLGVQSLGWRLDFARFRRYLMEKYGVITAYLFVGYIAENKDLYLSLQKYGYVLVFKPILTHKDGSVKGNVDAELVLQAMIDFSAYDKAVIISSDGDFYCLVKYLDEQKKFEAVISPYTKTCSSLLKKVAKGRLFFIDHLKNKLEYKRKSAA